MECSVVLSSEEGGFTTLLNIIVIFKDSTAVLKHIESRPCTNKSENQLEYLVTVICSKLNFIEILQRLEDSKLSILFASPEKVPWFPRCFNDLKRCTRNLYKYGSELSLDHPGYGDNKYKERREYFAEITMNYKLGNPIPTAYYTEEEKQTWSIVYTHQTQFYPSHACKEHNDGIKLLEDNCGYCAQNIPQLEVVSTFLKKHTGFRLCPVVGWIHSRDFLALLAFRVFPCTQYIRHHSKPRYTPEPDICHELLGHIPLFCNPDFADFSQSLGLASLGASDEWITKLSNLYWFTVEFGMVYENGQPKAYGAGLLSSCEEIEYCVTETPEKKPLICSEAVATKYPETGLQPLYYIADSLHDVKAKMIDFSKNISKPFVASFNKENESIIISSN